MSSEIENLQIQIAQLQKENAKLARQLARLQTTLERNKQLAVSSQSVVTMQAFEKRRQEQYMRLILENSPDVILLFDNEGRFSYCTNTFLSESGINYFFEINGKKFREVFSRFADEKWVCELAEILISACKTRQIVKSEISLNLSGKEVRRYLLQFVPMQSTDFDGSLMMLHDVTEIRLAQKNAEEARLQAEHASLAKSTFLSNMSHEMRTPLNAIIGMTAIGKSSQTVEKKEYCLGKIEEASTHLLGVINDILDISKIEANKFSISLTEFSFERMLQRVVNVINFRVEERGQELFVRIDRNIPLTVESDAQRISQVLTNLLSNAVKFTPENGKIHINIKLVSEEKNGDCVIQFDVTDTGIGINDEQKVRLFNAFEQADSSTSRNFGGTGLGLAISKRIVEMLNGKIWIESEFGKGSTFSFTIKTRRGSKENVNGLRPDITIDNLRMMVVDDTPEVLEYFKMVTQGLKIKCDVVASGIEACEKIEANGAYDVYFIDWKMPGMNGIELTRKIKEHGADKSVVIMISSAEWQTIEKNAREAGVDQFLQKPVFPSTIVDCLNDLVRLKGQNEQPKSIEGAFEGKWVLLAEDVKINREIVLARLEPTKVKVDCTVNGKEALEKFIEQPEKYAMIFMDMQMPGMDGLEATAAIRALNIESAKTIPIVAMTANVFREDIEKCIEAGMNDHIGKPLDFNIVMEKMRKYIG